MHCVFCVNRCEKISGDDCHCSDFSDMKLTQTISMIRALFSDQQLPMMHLLQRFFIKGNKIG